MTTPDELESYLLSELKSRVHIPDAFTDELILLNLLFIFSRDDHSAIDWVIFIEARFAITIPDNEADFFFFSSLQHMAAVIMKYLPSNI